MNIGIIFIYSLIMTITSIFIITLIYKSILNIFIKILGNSKGITKFKLVFRTLFGAILVFILNIVISQFIMMFTGAGAISGISNLAASIVIALLNVPIVNHIIKINNKKVQ